MLNRESLLERYREINDLKSISGVLGWDQETYMPEGSVDLRSRQLALQAKLVHEAETSKDYVDAVLGGAFSQIPGFWRLKRDVLFSTAVDAELASKMAHASVQTQEAWKKARPAKNFSLVAPYLKESLNLSREWARRLQAHSATPAELKTLSPYGLMLEMYEPGLRVEKLTPLMQTLGEGLKKLLPRALKNTRPLSAAEQAQLAMPLAEQEKLCLRVARDLGFDFSRGRLDRSAHPFCGGSPEDTRITVRYDEKDFLNALMSVMHETGHALYEQGLPADLIKTPAGCAASLGVHESQSRFIENVVGRSEAFARYLGGITGRDPKVLLQSLRHVERGLIRVDADEMTYNLHVFVRFDLERRLLEGSLSVEQLPQEWNRLYAEFVGLTPPDDGVGVLQDVHWYGGAFGYFVTYTLGNMLAAALSENYFKECPQWESQVERGEFKDTVEFLRKRVHRRAGLEDGPSTMKSALNGQELSPEKLLKYLETRYCSAG
jgi:carboxypeptidase Taq